MSATHKIATPDMPDGEFFFSVMRDSDAVGPIAEVYEGKIRRSPADILCD